MTAVERCETVLAGGIPDRVPVELHDFMVAARASGVPFPEFMRNGEAHAEGILASWREFGHDMIFTDNGTATLAEACGVGVELMEDSAPVSLTPAIASGAQNYLGSITPGKRADIVVLDKDIYRIAPEKIINTKVVLTIFNGAIVFSAA